MAQVDRANGKSIVKNPDPDDGLTQSERFIKAAQELGTDDDPERFAEKVKKLAKAKVPDNTFKAANNRN